jgi:hypothetical protein
MKRKPSKKTGIYSLISILNDNKFFAGIIMLIMNIGSKYISIELSKTQENYIKYSLGRQILVFAILWVGTRDVFTSLVLTAIFILLADYLFNENSKFCLIPNKYKELEERPITSKDVNDAINTLKIAQKHKNKDNDKQINNTLYKENFI